MLQTLDRPRHFLVLLFEVQLLSFELLELIEKVLRVFGGALVVVGDALKSYLVLTFKFGELET